VEEARLDARMLEALERDGRVEGDALVSLIETCCQTDEERDYLIDYSVDEWFDEYASTRKLASFLWEFPASMGSSDTLGLLFIGSHVYLYSPDETLDSTHPFLLLGATNAAAGGDALSDMVRAKLAPLFDDSEWGARLPTSTSNSAPDLVPREAFRDAYRTALTNSDVESAWSEEVVPEPDRRHAGDKPLDEEKLFDRWFETTYSEANLS
jgi:hypothetical protein